MPRDPGFSFACIPESLTCWSFNLIKGSNFRSLEFSKFSFTCKRSRFHLQAIALWPSVPATEPYL